MPDSLGTFVHGEAWCESAGPLRTHSQLFHEQQRHGPAGSPSLGGHLILEPMQCQHLSTTGVAEDASTASGECAHFVPADAAVEDSYRNTGISVQERKEDMATHSKRRSSDNGRTTNWPVRRPRNFDNNLRSQDGRNLIGQGLVSRVNRNNGGRRCRSRDRRRC